MYNLNHSKFLLRPQLLQVSLNVHLATLLHTKKRKVSVFLLLSFFVIPTGFKPVTF